MSAVRVPIRTIGAPVDRLDGREKVTGTVPYAFEQPVDRPCYP
jgi:xanthine dehydrogenase YagR molybdenum-binding subunit